MPLVKEFRKSELTKQCGGLTSSAFEFKQRKQVLLTGAAHALEKDVEFGRATVVAAEAAGQRGRKCA